MDEHQGASGGEPRGGNGGEPHVIRAGQGQQRPHEPIEEAEKRVFRAGQESVRAGAEQGGRAAREGVRTAGETVRTMAESGSSAYQQALQEWAGFTTRAIQRNTEALFDLAAYRSLPRFWNRQAHVLMSNTFDFMHTGVAMADEFSNKAGLAAGKLYSKAR